MVPLWHHRLQQAQLPLRINQALRWLSSRSNSGSKRCDSRMKHCAKKSFEDSKKGTGQFRLHQLQLLLISQLHQPLHPHHLPLIPLHLRMGNLQVLLVLPLR